ncbi:hypothetical protein GCM10010415_08160 [Streptomyces atrovirens]|uniref:Uncharacterized protein n=1 Tax=Streptomyces atrovirens TaxID=285556 RepID=A0ABW0DU67_9ACTN
MRIAVVSEHASPLAAPGGAVAVLDEDTPERLPSGPRPDLRGKGGGHAATGLPTRAAKAPR